MQIGENDNANSPPRRRFVMSMFFVCGSYGWHAEVKQENEGERSEEESPLLPPLLFCRLTSVGGHIFNFTSTNEEHIKKHCYAGYRKNTFVFPSLKDLFSESNSWSISVQSLLSPESVLPRNSTLYLHDEQGYRNVHKYVN